MFRPSLAFLYAWLGVFGAEHFDYDRAAPLDVRESAAQSSPEFTVREISYASGRGSRVPATLVIPVGSGRSSGLARWRTKIR